MVPAQRRCKQGSARGSRCDRYLHDLLGTRPMPGTVTAALGYRPAWRLGRPGRGRTRGIAPQDIADLTTERAASADHVRPTARVPESAEESGDDGAGRVLARRRPASGERVHAVRSRRTETEWIATPLRLAACPDGTPEASRIYPPEKEDMMESPRPEYTAELLRHFADLREGTHGDAISRRDKERLFTAAVALLDPHARQPLEEINTDLLLGTGEVTATGVRGRGDQTDHHPRLLRHRSSPPAPAGRYRRRLAAQCVRREPGGGRVAGSARGGVGRPPQPGLP